MHMLLRGIINKYYGQFCCQKQSVFSFDEDLCMVDYFSGQGEAHKAFSQNLNIVKVDERCWHSWWDLIHLKNEVCHIPRCKRTPD